MADGSFCRCRCVCVCVCVVRSQCVSPWFRTVLYNPPPSTEPSPSRIHLLPCTATARHWQWMPANGTTASLDVPSTTRDAMVWNTTVATSRPCGDAGHRQCGIRGFLPLWLAKGGADCVHGAILHAPSYAQQVRPPIWHLQRVSTIGVTEPVAV